MINLTSSGKTGFRNKRNSTITVTKEKWKGLLSWLWYNGLWDLPELEDDMKNDNT